MAVAWGSIPDDQAKVPFSDVILILFNIPVNIFRNMAAVYQLYVYTCMILFQIKGLANLICRSKTFMSHALRNSIANP